MVTHQRLASRSSSGTALRVEGDSRFLGAHVFHNCVEKSRFAGMAGSQDFRGTSEGDGDKGSFAEHWFAHQALALFDFIHQSPDPLAPFAFFVFNDVLASVSHVEVGLSADKVPPAGRIALRLALQKYISFFVVGGDDFA